MLLATEMTFQDIRENYLLKTAARSKALTRKNNIKHLI